MSFTISKLAEYNKDLKNAEIEGILHLIVNNQGMSNNDLIRKTGLPKETLRAFKTTISNLLVNSNADKSILKPAYHKELLDLNLKPYKWSLIVYEDEKVEKELNGIRRKYNMSPKREYDQFFATEQTSVAKAKIMEDKLDLSDKNIIFLGDDDLVSITLILLGCNPKSVTVLDIDKRILSVIEAVSKEMNTMRIRTVVQDLRGNPEGDLSNKFDIVVIDPPYTPDGVRLFINRSVQCLAKYNDYSGGYIFFYYGNSFKTPEKTLKIQDILNDFHLVIEDRIDKFSRYYGAETIGSTSALYVLKTTPFTTELLDVGDNSKIYTYDKVAAEKFPYVEHYTFKLTEVPKSLLKSRTAVLKVAGEFCTRHKLKVVDQKVTRFKGQGITITFVLSNSNLLVHTWPEHNAVHIDLVTCSPVFNREKLALNLKAGFRALSIQTRKIE